jgi:hypothetical protein
MGEIIMIAVSGLSVSSESTADMLQSRASIPFSLAHPATHNASYLALLAPEK